MAKTSIQSLLENLRKEESAVAEKTAAVKTAGDGGMVELIDGLRKRMVEDVSTERLVKNASLAGEKFAEEAVKKFKDTLNTEAFATKVAEKVASLILEKLAVETSEATVTTYSEPVALTNAMTSVEEESKKKDPKHQAADAKKDELVNRETIVGADAEGAKTASDSDILKQLLEAIKSGK